MLKDIENTLEFIKKELRYPDQIVLESPTGPEVIVGGKKILMFGSYNYLGLANNEFVKDRAISTIKQYGVGSGGVRILTGTMDIHRRLEKKIAFLTGQEDAMTIASGYGTNVGVIPGLINLLGFGRVLNARKAVIFCDELNHASIIDGTKLSDAKIVQYRHRDIDDLEKKLKKYGSFRKLIITDGIFSMDGDIAPLPEIIDLAKKNDAMTMVDDAHGFGVVGRNGAGTADYTNRRGEIDINMGAFSKGIGVSGGFVSAKKKIIELLRVSCRSYLFSDSLSPAIIGAVDAAIDFIQMNPQILLDVQKKSAYFRDELNKLGFSTLQSRSHIVPLLIGDPNLTISFSRELFKNGLFAPAIRWPAVPENLGRIRFGISASHSYAHIDKALNVVKSQKKYLDIS